MIAVRLVWNLTQYKALSETKRNQMKLNNNMHDIRNTIGFRSYSFTKMPKNNQILIIKL